MISPASMKKDGHELKLFGAGDEVLGKNLDVEGVEVNHEGNGADQVGRRRRACRGTWRRTGTPGWLQSRGSPACSGGQVAGRPPSGTQFLLGHLAGESRYSEPIRRTPMPMLHSTPGGAGDDANRDFGNRAMLAMLRMTIFQPLVGHQDVARQGAQAPDEFADFLTACVQFDRPFVRPGAHCCAGSGPLPERPSRQTKTGKLFQKMIP